MLFVDAIYVYLLDDINEKKAFNECTGFVLSSHNSKRICNDEQIERDVLCGS